MDGIPIGTVITMVISIGIAAGGIIIGFVAKASAAGAREDVVTLGGRMNGVETACEDTKAFIEESRKDRGELHRDFGDIKGDLRVLLERQANMSETLDRVHKKIFNGGA